MPSPAGTAQTSPNSARDVEDAGTAEPEKIEIPGRPMEPSLPRQKQHGSLQDETVPLDRSCEPGKETLNDPSAKEELEILAPVARQVEKLRAVRSGHVPDFLQRHTADSR